MNKHEEKHKSDVKENEKCGEMRGFATPKQGMRGPKQGIWALPKRAHPLWMHFAKPDQIHNTKSGWKQKNTTLFEQLLLPKLLPCRFISTFIYKQREKNGLEKVLQIPYFCFLAGITAVLAEGKKLS